MTAPTPTTPPKSVYSRRWTWNGSTPLRGLWNALLRLVIRAFTRFEIRGLEHVPADGGFIVMINHIHAFDPFVVLPWLPKGVTPMAKVEAFENLLLRPLVITYGAIPVHRGDVDTQAIRMATDELKAGRAILIAPEGTRSKTGALIPAQEGMAYIAARANAWVLPVAIVGTPGMLRSLAHLKRGRLTLTLGEPFRLSAEGRRPSREALQQWTDDAMRRMAALLPPEMRGPYA